MVTFNISWPSIERKYNKIQNIYLKNKYDTSGIEICNLLFNLNHIRELKYLS